MSPNTVKYKIPDTKLYYKPSILFFFIISRIKGSFFDHLICQQKRNEIIITNNYNKYSRDLKKAIFYGNKKGL